VRVNPKEQGRKGERAAAAWLLSQDAGVFYPFPEHSDIDLIAVIDEQLLRVQVKTTTVFRNGRWAVTTCTRGGNRSWSGLVKKLDASRCDYLFVLVGDGRQWFIPAEHLGGLNGLVLGGPKYGAFEVERGRPIVDEPAPQHL
jgi:hypothetical protein